MIRTLRGACVVALSLATSPFASAAEQAAGRELAMKGRSGAPACAQCHGANGEGQAAAGFPRLSGLPRDYVVKQLSDFRAGRRKNPVMEPIAKALDDAASAAVADYYAGLKVGVTRNAELPAASIALGARVAQRGNWDKNVPACFACHGPNGAGVPPHFPGITNQPATYTAKQLRDWKSGQRTNDPNGLMKSVADRLSDAEIDSVAAYLQNAGAINAK